MPPIYKYQVSLHKKTGIARDDVIWDFVADNPIGTTFESAIVAFLNTCTPYLSPALSANYTLRKYDISAHLDGSSAGPPVLTTTGSWTTPSPTTSMPNEVAATLSYHAEYTSIPEHAPGARPRARYRGRLFIGPLGQNVVLTDSTTAEPSLGSGPRTAFKNAGAALMATGFWGVWSRKDAAVRVVTGGWIDDAFDTQRRRGNDPLLRTTW